VTERVDHLLLHASTLVTMEGEAIPRSGKAAREIGKISDGAVAIRGERIVAAGPTGGIVSRFEAPAEATWDLRGCTVLPGFVDPHTHVLFAGTRESEFEMRLAGKAYMEIAAAGGGILSSVRAFREADDEAILAQTRHRLDTMLLQGTTTIEAKSGYGLSTEQEIRALSLLDRLDEEHPITILSTLLGAHAFPPEYAGDRAGYVRLVIEEMIPQAASRTRARFCDVFCEKGVFTPDEARAILVAAREHGLEPRLHADEFAPSGASELASELRAFSADHLMEASEHGLSSLREAGTIAILLPGTSFSMGNRRYAPARKILDMGIPVALATDCNPGSSMTANLSLILTLAVLEMKMTPGEALTAVTVNAAASLGVADEVGRITPGARADLQVLPAATPAGIVYQLGGLAPSRVMKSGRWVAAGGVLLNRS
jgi:imidazolonepropionase